MRPVPCTSSRAWSCLRVVGWGRGGAWGWCESTRLQALVWRGAPAGAPRLPAAQQVRARLTRRTLGSAAVRAPLALAAQRSAAQRRAPVPPLDQLVLQHHALHHIRRARHLNLVAVVCVLRDGGGVGCRPGWSGDPVQARVPAGRSVHGSRRAGSRHDCRHELACSGSRVQATHRWQRVNAQAAWRRRHVLHFEEARRSSLAAAPAAGPAHAPSLSIAAAATLAAACPAARL